MRLTHGLEKYWLPCTSPETWQLVLHHYGLNIYIHLDKLVLFTYRYLYCNLFTPLGRDFFFGGGASLRNDFILLSCSFFSETTTNCRKPKFPGAWSAPPPRDPLLFLYIFLQLEPQRTCINNYNIPPLLCPCIKIIIGDIRSFSTSLPPEI